MKLIKKEKYKIARAMLEDIVKFEGGEWIVNDAHAAVVRIENRYKCLFDDILNFGIYAKTYGISGLVCILCAPINTPQIIGFDANAVKTYAYLGQLPPTVGLPLGVEIKRLAPTLASTVLEAYHNPGSYSIKYMEKLMRTKGVFGAISDGKLVGFIGRHVEGDMGMLEVFENYRRRGIGSALERFMINYIMTFSRTPVCDVYIDNEASMALQEHLEMTPAPDYTFWGEYRL